MRKLLALLCILFSIVSFEANGQAVGSVTGRQTVIQVPTTGANSGLSKALLWLPTTYNVDNPNTRYAIIYFLHGGGESTNNGAYDINRVHTTALPKIIADGWNAEAVNPVDGLTYKFIVVSPQSTPTNSSFSQTHLKWIHAYMKANYRVDTTRVYATGLSQGGAGTWTIAGANDSNMVKTFAAIYPVAGVSFSGYPGTSSANLEFASKKYGLAVAWAAGTADSYYGNPGRSYQVWINIPNPAIRAYRSGVSGAGHSSAAWNTIYDPNWRDSSNRSVYQFFLSYSRTPATAPTVNAGNDQSITLPTSEVTLAGSATPIAGRTITDYQWTKVSGPGTGTIVSPSLTVTGVTGLSQGTYVFRLTATDSQGEIGLDEVTVVVNPSGVPPVANAGPTRVISLPTSSVTLDGTGSSDPDGTISTYSWTREVGSNGTISTPTLATTNVTGLTQQTYRYRLTVTDNSGASAWDTVTVVVNPASPHTAPVVTPGYITKTITLPKDTVGIWSVPTAYDGANISRTLISKYSDPNYEPVLLLGIGSSTLQGTGASNTTRSYF
jgi:hypothetical protein